MKHKWWQDAIFYQIYVRSFYDSNNDGIGDINGIILKLNYLKDLGVSAIWLSPFYDSPMDDNGYDIRDHYMISPDYGTIDDFKLLLKEAHKLGIKVIADLVLNHTSDEHEWFKKGSDPNNDEFKKYHDYYIWQKPKYIQGKRTYPTRYLSWFGSPAWSYNEKTNEYYMHIFSKKMPDLNWHNKDMVNELKEMIKWWVDLGIDGFRVDASNHLEKNWDFPDAYPGYENFCDLEPHHMYIKELSEEIFIPNDLVTIGESGGATKEAVLRYASFDSHEFNMVIQFGHCWCDCDDENEVITGKWAKGKLDLKKVKESFYNNSKTLYKKGWSVIYWHNHDQPRINSHYGNESASSAKMLAIALYFMPGTPICYYGEEIGMTNVKYKSVRDFRDVEVFTEYNNFISRGATKKEAIKALCDRSRDNARTPMQWNDTPNGGFSVNTPWIKTNDNYPDINVSKEEKEKESVLSLYKKIFKLRNEDEGLRYGKLVFYDIEDENSFIYENISGNGSYLVICNFSNKEIPVSLKMNINDYKLVLTNDTCEKIKKDMILKPYQALVYKK